MCILFCYLQDDNNVDIGYDLILLSNRDEYFQRPAKNAHVWKDTNYVLGGQDQTPLREGGTWLCLNTAQCRIGVLLNLTSRLLEGERMNGQSRGSLVPNFVNRQDINLDSYMEELQKTKMNYTGFNFLGLERHSESKKWRAKYINNISSSSSAAEIKPSNFGFSNHIYGDQYAFEKTRYGCQLFRTFLTDLTDNNTKSIINEKELIHRAFNLLNDRTLFLDDDNIATVYSHYSQEQRHQISSIHVCPTPAEPTYGTRTSTIILIRRDQTGLFIEKTLSDPLVNASEWTDYKWSFNLNNVNEPPVLIN